MSVTAASTCSRFGSDVPLFCNNSACLASAWAGCVSAISCVLEAGALTPTLPLLPRDPISMVFPPNRTRREKSHPFPRRSYRQLTLAQQAEDRLRQLVGLGQHRSTRLLHDLVLGQVGRFRSVVGIHDTTAGSRGVLSNVLQVADGRLEAVLHGTEVRSGAVYRGDGIVEGLDGQLSVPGSQDVQAVDSMVGTFCHPIGIRLPAIETKNLETCRITIFNCEILKGGQNNTITVFILRSSHACTGVIDLIYNLVEGVSFLKADDSAIQLDAYTITSGSNQLAHSVKTIRGNSAIIFHVRHCCSTSLKLSQSRLTAQPFGTHITNTERQGFTRIGTNLEALAFKGAIQQVLATKCSGLRNPSKFT